MVPISTSLVGQCCLRSRQLALKQPGIESAGIKLGDAVLNLAEMAGSDLSQPSALAGGWAGLDSLLIQPVEFSVEVLHQFQQRIAVPDLLLIERDAEARHPDSLRKS